MALWYALLSLFRSLAIPGGGGRRDVEMALGMRSTLEGSIAFGCTCIFLHDAAGTSHVPGAPV